MTPNPDRDTPSGSTRITRARHWIDQLLGQEPSELDTTIDEILSSPTTSQAAKKLARRAQHRYDIQWLVESTVLLCGTGVVLGCALIDIATARLWTVVGTHAAGTVMLVAENHTGKDFKTEIRRLAWAVHITGTAIGIRYFMEG